MIYWRRERNSDCRSLLILNNLLIILDAQNSKNSELEDSLHVYCTWRRWPNQRDFFPECPSTGWLNLSGCHIAVIDYMLAGECLLHLRAWR